LAGLPGPFLLGTSPRITKTEGKMTANMAQKVSIGPSARACKGKKGKAFRACVSQDMKRRAKRK